MPRQVPPTEQQILDSCDELLKELNKRPSVSQVRDRLVDRYGSAGAQVRLVKFHQAWRAKQDGVTRVLTPNEQHLQAAAEGFRLEIRKEFQAVIDRLTAEKQEIVEASQELELQLKERDSRIENLEAHVKDFQRSVDAADASIATLQSTVSTLAATSDQVVQVHRDVDTVRNAVGVIADRVSGLSGPLAEISAALKQLRAEQDAFRASYERQQDVFLAALPNIANHMQALAERAITIDAAQAEASYRILERLALLETRQTEQERRASQRTDRILAQLGSLHRRIPKE